MSEPTRRYFRKIALPRVAVRRRAAVALLALATLVSLSRTAAAQVVVNELLASNQATNADEDGDSSDWVELLNVGATPFDLAGWGLSDDPLDPLRWRFPAGAVLEPGARLLVWCSGKDRTELSPDGLLEPDSPIELGPGAVSLAGEWRYLSGAPEAVGPPENWSAVGFDDRAWTAGTPPFGFGRGGPFATEIPEDLGALFLRHTFAIDSPEQLAGNILRARYDDGFVAWLNGVRFVSAGFAADEEPTFASVASSSHSASSEERFPLEGALDALAPGENVLAVALLNRTHTGSDLHLELELGVASPVFHTGFKLAAGGGVVLLAAPDGRVADGVEYPPQERDQSYARAPDGSGAFLFHRDATPLAPNDGPSAPEPLKVADTRFSVDRGFYESPFEVAITTATPQALVVYTTDGSPPAVGEDLTVINGTRYEGPVPIAATTTLRAAAFLDDWDSTDVDTHTYIFLDDVIAQSPDGRAPPGWPSRQVAGQSLDYGMDPNITGVEPWASQMAAALTQVPTLSIVTDLDHLMHPSTGIYVHAQNDGRAWERPMSVELIYPDGSTGFQINAGLRIRGGFSRGGFNPKHSFRFFFRGEYGAGKLEYALFGDEGVDEFDAVDLRTAQNYAWSNDTFNDQTRNSFLRDVYTRDLQGEQGQPYTRSRYYHLYLNGQYWGLYQTEERPEASFAQSYLGGAKEEYDAIKASGGQIVATDGDLFEWQRLSGLANQGFATAEAYFASQGKNPDGSDNPDLEAPIDVDNVVDFMINVFYTANRDMPVSLGGGGPNNFWTVRNRVRGDGWQFVAHDNEHNMLDVNEDLTSDVGTGTSPANLNPKYLHQQLDDNPEYRLAFADRVHALFAPGGLLAVPEARARMERRAAQIERAIIAESARWGDQHNEPPLTQDTWSAELEWLLDVFLARRGEVVLEQFRSRGLYPPANRDAPTLSPAGGRVAEGTRLSVGALFGVVHLTIDGSDPREIGGAVSPGATEAGTAVETRLVAPESPMRFLVPPDGSLGRAWTAVDFDDSGWTAGLSSFGLETREGYEGLILTDIEAVLFDVSSTVYCRIAFDLDDGFEPGLLTLAVNYDDGFVAYLNGVEIAARNAPEDPAWNSESARSRIDRDALEAESIDLSPFGDLLRPGRNVLAVHAMNTRADNNDLLFVPVFANSVAVTAEDVVLERSTMVQARSRSAGGEEWSPLARAEFVVGPQELRVTELYYHPLEPRGAGGVDPEALEFIEIQNIGATALNLSRMRLEGGIEFVFPDRDAFPAEDLPAGEVVLVVKDLAAFASVRDTRGLRIAGEYDGQLANSGDSVTLTDRLGTVLQSFAYSDDWYPVSDGEGASLEAADATRDVERWSEPEAWRPSAAAGGTPGFAPPVAGGARVRPGDANLDGGVNISDALALLLTVFGSRAAPCDGDVASGGNRTLLDVNGDRVVDISDAVAVLAYLFAGGAPPVLGADCVAAPGCAEACAVR